jgi:predicted enzyme related to lactoylglutathione lyase
MAAVGERTGYPPGTFCWVDLATDPTAALAFYSALFGWTPDKVPGPEDTYATLRLRGHDVAGLFPMPEDQRAAGIPPYWTSYVSVEDVDATAQRVSALGGTVMAQPFDVAGTGRMAPVHDPQGAVFALWQAGPEIGAELVNDPGALCLNQLNTSDPEAAQRFYSDLFGWEVRQATDDPQPYWGIWNGGALNAGMMRLAPEAQAPPHWLVYFTVEDLDAAVGTIGEQGGTVVVAPMPIQAGRIAVASDPQGGYFALFEGPVDP